MIYLDGTNAKIEAHKKKLGISGDVYLVDGHLMESLESHKKAFPNSSARTIAQAEAERVLYEQEQRRIREEKARAEAERLANERMEENTEASSEDTGLS